MFSGDGRCCARPRSAGPLTPSAGAGGGRRKPRQQAEDDQNQRLSDLEQQQAPPPPAPAPAAPATSSMLDQLTQLAALHEQGALTDDEFTAAKAKLLGT